RWGFWLRATALLVITVIPLAGYLALFTRLAKPSGKVMLVVVPFLNMSGDPSQEYVADGMTEEMITQLSRLNPKRLGVIARTTSMQLKGTHKDAAQIRREFKANYLLEGSVRPEG